MKSIRPGAVIAEKYVIERVIGRGGVGIIAAARHVTLRQLVALKFLRPEIENDPEVMQRFLREAQAAAQIRSEHVVRVMDAGSLADGTAFLVFEHLAGRDLAAVLREDGPLAIADAVDYVTQACEAIGEAHALGIVHRDLKPANLFLTRAPDGAPFVKVLDFGLSKFNRSAATTLLTADNHVIGSPHFMSPEQMRSSRDADARSDIWALGVVLFGLLSGRVPFEGEYLTEVCAAVLAGEPLSLRALRPETAPELEAVILSCLRTDPEERPQTISALVAALHPFAPAHAQARAERIARVVDGTKRALDASGAELAAPSLAALTGTPARHDAAARDGITSGSSPVSWSVSVGRARSPIVNSAESASASHAPADGVVAPTAPPIAAQPAASVRARSRRGSLLAGASMVLVAALTAALWLRRGTVSERHAARPTASANVATAPPSPSLHAARTALPVPPTPTRSEPPPLEAPAPPQAARLAGPASVPSSEPAAVASSRRPPARGKTPSSSPPRRPASSAATRARSDEELIIGLPH